MTGEVFLKEEKEKILDLISKADYPPEHPFLKEYFYNDFYMNAMAIFIKLFNGEVIIKDLIHKKLNGKVSGKFNNNRFQEGIGEFNVLYYLVMSFMMKAKNDDVSISGVYYEPPAFVDGKTLEYSLDIKLFDIRRLVAIEVKTIETAPEYREDESIKIDNKYVKPFFSDTNLSELGLESRDDFEDLKYLEKSTHYRQLSKNIKRINEKFCETKGVINAGVVIFQLATSMEEIFSYLFHETKGIYNKNRQHFSNLDILVIYSLTSTPSINMQDMYDNNHVLTLCLTDENWKQYMFDHMRLDNYLLKDNAVKEWVKPYINKEYGVYKYRLSNGLLFFIDENEDGEWIEEYTKELSVKINPKNVEK